MGCINLLWPDDRLPSGCNPQDVIEYAISAFRRMPLLASSEGYASNAAPPLLRDRTDGRKRGGA